MTFARRTLWLCLLSLVVAVPGAAASTYPGERDAMTNPLVRQTVQIAQDFWHARGVQPCSAPNVMLADSLWDTDVEVGVEPAGRADQPGCNVWIHAEIVSNAQDLYMGGSETLNLCVTVVHEMGHSAGLGHTEDGSGVMGAQGLAVPYECKVWARKVDRRKARAFHRLYGRSTKIRRGVG
jgi:hypothetical protein